jgi:hypothetical protein
MFLLKLDESIPVRILYHSQKLTLISQKLTFTRTERVLNTKKELLVLKKNFMNKLLIIFTPMSYPVLK